MNNQELIVVKQLPIIEEQLKEVGQQIDSEIEEALAMESTEENKQAIKAKRAKLRKDFNNFEERRKDVKRQVTEPYNKFEEIYERYIGEKYKKADEALKSKSDSIEIEQKRKLEEESKDYFKEYQTSKNIDFLTFEDAGIKIGVSDSLTKLKKQIVAFVDKVEEDIALINTQENREEIFLEYKENGLNVSNAITKTKNRLAELERLRQIREVEEKLKEEMSKNLENIKKATQVEEKTILQAPKTEKIETKDENEIIEHSFKAIGKRKDIKEIVNYAQKLGIKIYNY